MQVELSLGYLTLIADLSGAELEVLSRIMAKAVKIDGDRTVGNRDIFVASSDPLKFTAKVHAPVVMIVDQQEFGEMAAIETQERRAVLLKNSGTPEGMKELLRDFYYASVIKKDEFEGECTSRVEFEGEYAFYLATGRRLAVKTDGTHVIE